MILVLALGLLWYYSGVYGSFSLRGLMVAGQVSSSLP